MTGGAAFLFDPEGLAPSLLNPQLVEARHIEDTTDISTIKTLLDRHIELTGSPRAHDIAAMWEEALGSFWKVAPIAITPPPIPAEQAAGSEQGVAASR
jgi:glutamate synthase domain-containing protein 3